MEIREEQKGGLQSVILQNDILQITVLPELGGKIADLLWKPAGFQLAAQPRKNYQLPDFGSDFSRFDASGLDDGFPCLHARADPVSGYDYPDHGEIWSAGFERTYEENVLRLCYESPHFPYRYEKRISLAENRVTLMYHIENTGNTPFPCIWAFHGLMRYEENIKIRYPKNSRTVLNTLESPLLGAPGQQHHWDDAYDFSTVPAKTPPSMVKYYFTSPVAEGRCGFWYPAPGVGCLLRYDPATLPYLGVWITAGGFRGDYNCALEPSNGFYDDVGTARQNGALYRLLPGCALEFTLELEITDIESYFWDME